MRKAINPFYVGLLLVGVVFCLTACAYGVMTVKGLYPDSNRGGERWLGWLDEHGFRLMVTELVLLALATLAAILTDGYWEVRRRPYCKAKRKRGDG